MSDEKVIEVFAKIFGSYNLFLIFASVILNPIVAFICIKSKRLRSTSTFKILAIGAINDILVCLVWNFESFTDTFFNFQAYFRNFFWCRFFTIYFQWTTVQFQSWLVVTISIDRVLSLYFKKWSTHYFNGKKPIIFTFILGFFIACVNINEVFLIGYQDFVNGTEIVACFIARENEIDWHTIMSKVQLYFGFIVPYALLIVADILIIYKATRFDRLQGASENTTTSSRRKAQMTRTILFLAIVFIITSLPNVLFIGYFISTVYYFSYGFLMINLMNGIQYSYSAFHFFILYFTNKLFAEEVKSLVFAININRVSTVNSNSNNSKLRGSTKNVNRQKREETVKDGSVSLNIAF